MLMACKVDSVTCVCVSHEEFLLHAGGRVTSDTARPTKRVSVGAEAVEDRSTVYLH